MGESYKCFNEYFEKRQRKEKLIFFIITGISVFVIVFFYLFPIRQEFLLAENKNCNYSSIVIDTKSGRILHEENKDIRLPMASTTKIMTALVAIENGKINSVVKIPKEAVGIEGSSIYLKEGELLTLKELLYGLMLQSGNDASIAIAIAVGGSVDNFVKMMNDKIQSLGLKNSHFENPNGLHHDNHYTSAYDLAMISRAAMNNQTFREIVGTKNVKIPYENFDGESREIKTFRYLKNKNKILSEFDGGIGIKTGFTKKAGRCLVSSAKRNNGEVICVVLNHPDMFGDSKRYMEEAFSNYPGRLLIEKGKIVKSIRIKNSTMEFNDITVEKNIIYPLSVKELDNIKYEIRIFDNLKAPIKNGEILGKIYVYLYNQLISEENLITIKDIKDIGIMDHFKNMVE